MEKDDNLKVLGVDLKLKQKEAETALIHALDLLAFISLPILPLWLAVFLPILKILLWMLSDSQWTFQHMTRDPADPFCVFP